MGVACVLAMVPAPAPATPTTQVDPLAQLEAAQQRIFAQWAPSVVYIHTQNSFGSGFYVSRDGLVLTNAHVVENATTVGIVLHDGTRLTGTVLEKAKKTDLALVQVPVATSVPIPLADGDTLQVGAWAAAIGHGRGGIWTFLTGMVSNIYPDDQGRSVFQTQIPLNQGASGGPIVDRKGRVIGVVTAKLRDAEGINFAINIAVALRDLKSLAARCDCLVITAPEGVPVFLNGVMQGSGPRLVIPVATGSYEVTAVIKDRRRKVTVQVPGQRSVKLDDTSATK